MKKLPGRNTRDYGTYLKMKATGDALVLLAILEGNAVGFVESELRKDYVYGASKRPIWYVEGIFVDPEFRRHNVGTKLVHGLAEWVEAKELASDCELGQEDSRLFHEGAGFQEVGRSLHFWMDLTRKGDET